MDAVLVAVGRADWQGKAFEPIKGSSRGMIAAEGGEMDERGGARDNEMGTGQSVGKGVETAKFKLTLLFFSSLLFVLQFHWDRPCAKPGACGEGAHLPDVERADFDGRFEQPQHSVLCVAAGQGCPGGAVEGRWTGRNGWRRRMDR